MIRMTKLDTSENELEAGPERPLALKTPAKKFPRDLTGKHLQDDARDASPARTLRRDRSMGEGLGVSKENGGEESGTILQDKEDQDDLQGASIDDPDPRIRWASRNGFNSRESYKDLQAILRLLQDWFILPQDMQQEGEIDRGSFGSIFTGKFCDQPVAIKHVGNMSAGSGMSYPQIFRAMRLELSIASTLQHPNIVQFRGMTAFFPIDQEQDAQFYIGFVFELCPEGSLFSLIHRKKAMKTYTFLMRMSIARDIACGMSYVHERNIVHRDLSTRNILLGAGRQVKIADFGCARQIVGDSYESTTISGSPAYMSPEQLQGRDLTLKVDVWAVGVIMWELLNEEIPWSDRRNCNDRKALAKHVAVGGARLRKTPNNKLTRDETARSTVNDIMEAAFQASTDKRPSMSKMHQRLQTMTDAHEHVALELEACQQRLESQLRSFYAKHNPTKIAEVSDLASLFQGKEHVLNERLRASYKEDLTTFQANGPEVSSSVSVHGSSSAEDVPSPDDIAEKLKVFYMHLNPAKMKAVPLLLKRYEGDYLGLNQELRSKYSLDLRASKDEIMRASSSSSNDDTAQRKASKPVGGSMKPMTAEPTCSSDAMAEALANTSETALLPTKSPARSTLPRGTSAPPMQESPPPPTTAKTAQDERRSLLTFFYEKMNPSKVKDVSHVLTSFRNKEAILNDSLRKTYGVDLSSSRQEIIDAQVRREEQKRLAAQAVAAGALVAEDAAKMSLTTQEVEEEFKSGAEGKRGEDLAAAEEGEGSSNNKAAASAKTVTATEVQGQSGQGQGNGFSQVRGANLNDGTQKVASEKEEDADAIADMKGRLFRFYIAWNVFDPPNVGTIAATYVNSPDKLNKRLRSKYQGTDLTWTPEQIGLHIESLESHGSHRDNGNSGGADGRGSPGAGEECAQTRVEKLALLLSAFYKTWNVSRGDEDTRNLAHAYCDKVDALNRQLQTKYFGTDLTWSASALDEKARSVRHEENLQREDEQKRLQARDARVAEVRDKLSEFYAAWALDQGASAIESDADNFIQSPASFNTTLRSLYHGTDLSWAPQDVRDKVHDVRAQARLTALVEKLVPFYTFWGADDANSEATRMASTFLDDVVSLKMHLRAAYHGISPPSTPFGSSLLSRFCSAGLLCRASGLCGLSQSICTLTSILFLFLICTLFDPNDATLI